MLDQQISYPRYHKTLICVSAVEKDESQTKQAVCEDCHITDHWPIPYHLKEKLYQIIDESSRLCTYVKLNYLK